LAKRRKKIQHEKEKRKEEKRLARIMRYKIEKI
jgi:hypothetical protein